MALSVIAFRVALACVLVIQAVADVGPPDVPQATFLAERAAAVSVVSDATDTSTSRQTTPTTSTTSTTLLTSTTSTASTTYAPEADSTYWDAVWYYFYFVVICFAVHYAIRWYYEWKKELPSEIEEEMEEGQKDPKLQLRENVLKYSDYGLGFVVFAGLFLFVGHWLGGHYWTSSISILACYVVISLGVFFGLKPDNATRQAAEAKYLCCWRGLYVGRACPVYVILASPFLLVWHSCRIYLSTCVQVYAMRLYWRATICCRSRYTDPNFPPIARSLGDVKGDTANKDKGKTEAEVIWVRAGDFLEKDLTGRTADSEKGAAGAPKPKFHETTMNLFEGQIEPNDIKQGALGDCWLLAAMACLAEHPGAVNDVFITKELSPIGKYKVRLFDPKDNKWKKIVVDDFVPCKKSAREKDGVARGDDGRPATLYARPNRSEIWAMLLEKAVAKMLGGYAAIEGGFTEWGIVCLTGRQAYRYQFDKAAGGTFKCLKLTCKGGVQMMTAPARQEGFGSKPLAPYSSDDFFSLLQYYDRNGAVQCCSGADKSGEDLGLHTGHAYSLLQAKQVTLSGGNYIRMVQIRNPWGDGEWKGDWCDGSKLWEQHPNVKSELGYVDSVDGAFWMSWEDFCKYWGNAGIIDKSLDILSVHSPTYDDASIWGPLEGAGKGCLEFWCKCKGPFRFFINHEASNTVVTKKEYEDWGGCDPSGCYFRFFHKKAVQAQAGGKSQPLLA